MAPAGGGSWRWAVTLALTLAAPVGGWTGSIAVVSAFSDPRRSVTSTSSATDGKLLKAGRDQLTPPGFRCQWSNHREYCTRHNYTCFLVVDWHTERQRRDSEWRKACADDPFPIAPHWYKVFVLRRVLPKFAAVILVDYDAVFADLDRPFGPLLDAARGRWWLVHDDTGISSHALILKNNQHSRAMAEHLWGLRHVCPACIGEQCAVHLVLHDLLLDWALQRGLSEVYVAIDPKNRHVTSCCSPSDHCEYPTGSLAVRNRNHSWSVQGCTWRWWDAFQRRSLRMRETHRHVHWVTPAHRIVPRRTAKAVLNLIHPVKDTAKCEQLNPHYDPTHPPDPRPILAARLWRLLAEMPDLEPASHPPPRWGFNHSALDVTRYARGYTPRSTRFCRILPLRGAVNDAKKPPPIEPSGPQQSS